MPNVEITIHLFKGTHYAVENRFDALNIYLEKAALDNHALNIEITVKPLLCGRTREGDLIDSDHCFNNQNEKVIIYNKIRERFLMPVYVKLHLERVIIDSIDSILPFGTPCLSEHRPCCKI